MTFIVSYISRTKIQGNKYLKSRTKTQATRVSCSTLLLERQLGVYGIVQNWREVSAKFMKKYFINGKKKFSKLFHQLKIGNDVYHVVQTSYQGQKPKDTNIQNQ